MFKIKSFTTAALMAALTCTARPADAQQDREQWVMEAAIVSLAAYETDPNVRQAILDRASLTEFSFFEVGDQEVLIAGTETGFNPVFVGFAGTDFSSFGDVATDMYFAPFTPSGSDNFAALCQNTPGCGVHAGFEDRVQEVLNYPGFDLKDAIQNLTQVLPVVLTGHSLGGAIAQVMYAHLEADGVQPERMITFAAPMVGTSGFVDVYEDELLLSGSTHRWVLENDPVPLLPLHFFSNGITGIGALDTFFEQLTGNLINVAGYADAGPMHFVYEYEFLWWDFWRVETTSQQIELDGTPAVSRHELANYIGFIGEATGLDPL